MKRSLFLIMLVGVFALITGIPALASTSSTLSSTVSSSNVLPNGRPAANCTSLDNAGTFYYSKLTFQVTASGAYTYIDGRYTLGTIDTYIAVYTGSFDPSNPLGNGCQFNFDDGGTANLSAGVTYTMMFSSWSSGVTGDAAAILTGPGAVVVGGLSNPMLADGRINGQQGAPVILYCADDHTVLGYSAAGQKLFELENGATGSGPGWTMGTAPDGRMLLISPFPDGKLYYFAFPGCPHGHYDALSGTPPTLFDSGDY